jgi:adenosylcobinamide kinase/adenosylcobinamide-phosphate guanylyltransferase
LAVGDAPLILVTGGQRSGKSRYAERLATADGRAPVYLATATAGDAEMAQRIAAHRSRRGEAWKLVEEPTDLPGALTGSARPDSVVLVECLTLWVSNLMGQGLPIAAETDRLMTVLARPHGSIVLVSNEVGSGIIPDSATARSFADHLGTLNQRIGAVADRVVLVAAGVPLVLKPGPAA